MKVIEQEMSHNKNFYPSTLLPTLPTFGNKDGNEAARLETEILKLSKEWGGQEERPPLTPSTDISTESLRFASYIICISYVIFYVCF